MLSLICMAEYECSHPSCSFTSHSQHGLNIHDAMVHARLGAAINSFNQRRRVLPVPRALHGPGARLPLDRVTRELCPPDTDENMHEQLREQLFPDVNWSDILPTTNEGTEEQDGNCNDDDSISDLCAAFLSLNRVASRKQCNSLLDTFRKHKDSLPSFLTCFDTIDDITESARALNEHTLRRQGFQENEVHCDGGLRYVVFYKSPIDVLREQIRNTFSDDIICSPTASNIMSHPMNSKLGNKLVPLVKSIICKSESSTVTWREVGLDGEQSVVACIQLFSDKSQASLSASAFKFYPLHINLLNYREAERRSHITDGRTVFAYLPVRFDASQDHVDGKKPHFDRVDFIRALHHAIEFVLEPLGCDALRGASVKTADEKRLRLHFVLSSYVSDTPEAEDLLGVKRGNNTESPCHRCNVSRDQMPFSTCERYRCTEESRQIIKAIDGNVATAFDKLKQMSMLPLLPVLSSFPLVAIHPCNDIYNIFRFEPMHFLSLGISKMLKECAVEMLKDENRTTSAILSRAGEPRTFKFVRKRVLRCLNEFLRDVESSSRGYGLHVDFSSGESGLRLSGFFTEHGIVGMLEAKDYDVMDMVSPFIGAIIDRCCGLVDVATVTSSFTQYVDLVSFIFRRNMVPGWTNLCLQSLDQEVQDFKHSTFDAFSMYQSSRMGTSKWHFLDHLVGDLRDMGGIEYLSCGQYEYSHRLTKEDYSLTSRRVDTALRETVNRQADRCILARHRSVNDAVRKPNPSRIRAVREDAAYLVQRGDIVTINELDTAIKMCKEMRKQNSSELCATASAGLLTGCLGIEGASLLVQLLLDQFEIMGTSCDDAQHLPICLPASAFVSGYVAPTLLDGHVGTSVFMPRTSFRQSQRVVAKARFYGSKPRQDSVILESDTADDMFPTDQYFPVWFAKALAFVRINTTTDSSNERCSEHSLKGCDACASNLHREFCFVQYYDVLGADNLEVDAIDKKLNCIRLRWHRTQGDGSYASSREYGLVPVDSIRGRIHVVRGDVGMELVHESLHRKAQLVELCNGELGWPSQMFYVNRFYRCPGEEYNYGGDGDN